MNYNLRSSQTTAQLGPQLSPRRLNLSLNPPPVAPARESRPTRIRKPSTKVRENVAWAQELRMKRKCSAKQKMLPTGQGKPHTARSNVNASNKAVPPGASRASQNKFIDPDDGDILFPDVQVLCHMIGDELDEFFRAFQQIEAYSADSR